MTYQEIAAHIRRMPVQERLELLDVLARSLKDDLELPGRVTSSLERIRGIAKPDGEPLNEHQGIAHGPAAEDPARPHHETTATRRSGSGRRESTRSNRWSNTE
jgi:hypothetical protein